MKTFFMTSAAAILLAGTALAQSTMDANGDGMVDREEYMASMGENTFGSWDADGDGMLSRAEYEAGTEAAEDADAYGTWDDRYSEWDADADEMLSTEEYSMGMWSTFDSDADDTWNEDEMTAWEEDEMRYDATRSGRDVSK